MTDDKPKWKVKDEFSVKCPSCKTKIVVKHEEKTVIPAVPAEKEERTRVEIDTQKTLDEE